MGEIKCQGTWPTLVSCQNVKLTSFISFFSIRLSMPSLSYNERIKHIIVDALSVDSTGFLGAYPHEMQWQTCYNKPWRFLDLIIPSNVTLLERRLISVIHVCNTVKQVTIQDLSVPVFGAV